MKAQLKYTVSGTPSSVFGKVDAILSEVGWEVIASRQPGAASGSKTYRSAPFQARLLFRRPFTTRERMAQGVIAHQGGTIGVGRFAEEERVVWVDKRVTMSVRALDARRVEVSCTTETYADKKPWHEATDEAEFNQAIRDRLSELATCGRRASSRRRGTG
ncbi:MAG: hypothetical protein ACRDOL_21040 [Streptosporangiaceae bacterium]